MEDLHEFDPFEEELEGSEERFISERSADRQERWEDRVVRRIVQARFTTAADGAAAIASMRSSLREQTDRTALTMEILSQHFPSFPMWIISRPIPYAHKHVDYGEFQAKREHWFVKLWKESLLTASNMTDYRPVGLVFEMVNKNSQFNLLHNHQRRKWPQIKGASVVINDPKNAPEGPLWLEPLDFYLASINWTPKSSE